MQSKVTWIPRSFFHTWVLCTLYPSYAEPFEIRKLGSLWQPYNLVISDFPLHVAVRLSTLWIILSNLDPLSKIFNQRLVIEKQAYRYLAILFKDSICSGDSRTYKDSLLCHCSFGVHLCLGSLSVPQTHSVFLPLKDVFISLLHLSFSLAEGAETWPSGPSAVFIVCVVFIFPYKSPFISVHLDSKKRRETPFTSMVNWED